MIQWVFLHVSVGNFSTWRLFFTPFSCVKTKRLIIISLIYLLFVNYETWKTQNHISHLYETWKAQLSVSFIYFLFTMKIEGLKIILQVNMLLIMKTKGLNYLSFIYFLTLKTKRLIIISLFLPLRIWTIFLYIYIFSRIFMYLYFEDFHAFDMY